MEPPNPVSEMVRQAERSRARIFDVPGKVAPTEYSQFQHDLGKLLSSQELIHSVMVDEDYLVVGTHVDDQTKHKIILGEYVDFSRLIPKNRIISEEDNRMEMINQGGHTYWVPASDRNTVMISNFSWWEQAFRVYSNIYTKQFPMSASELIQYNHIIHTASLSNGLGKCLFI